MSCHSHDTSTGDGGMSNDAKVENNSELLIMNAELFAPNKSARNRSLPISVIKVDFWLGKEENQIDK